MGVAGVVFFGATLASGAPALGPEMAAALAGVGATAGVVTQVCGARPCLCAAPAHTQCGRDAAAGAHPPARWHARCACLAHITAHAACTHAHTHTQVFARAAKYSLFDPAKEMVYIEM
jgi:hypothetical protein